MQELLRHCQPISYIAIGDGGVTAQPLHLLVTQQQSCPVRREITLQTSLPAMGQQSEFTFSKWFGKSRELPSPAPCNSTPPRAQQTSEHQFHTQNMTQATGYHTAQGSQAERLVPSCKNHSSPTPQHNQHKEKTLDTRGFLFLRNTSCSSHLQQLCIELHKQGLHNPCRHFINLFLQSLELERRCSNDP